MREYEIDDRPSPEFSRRLALLCMLWILVAGGARGQEPARLPDNTKRGGAAGGKTRPEPADGAPDSSTVVGADYAPLNGAERFDLYLKRTFASGSAYYGPIFSAARNQAGGEPHEWGGGMEGYGRRLASKVGTSMIRGTIRSAAAAAFGEDPRFILKRDGSVSGRMAHAVAFTVLTIDEKGRTRPALSVVGSYVAANLIAQQAWLPARLTPRDGLREAGQQLLGAALFNQVREFWPEIRRHVLRRR
jgi:hypothetical protein